MREDIQENGTGNGSERGDSRRTDLDADAVRAGDRVVFTSKLNEEYEFTVVEVDASWLTFGTGQMVHKDRFDREEFAVVRTAAEEKAGRATVTNPDAPNPDAEPSAAGGAELQTPNAN